MLPKYSDFEFLGRHQIAVTKNEGAATAAKKQLKNSGNNSK